eukprot:5030507-Amphidinium_carterae.1
MCRNRDGTPRATDVQGGTPVSAPARTILRSAPASPPLLAPFSPSGHLRPSPSRHLDRLRPNDTKALRV